MARRALSGHADRAVHVDGLGDLLINGVDERGLFGFVLNLGYEAGVAQRDGQLPGDGLQQLRVGLAQAVDVAVLGIEHA